MKIKLSFLTVFLLSVLVVVLSSCKEKDVYDYDSIEPIIFGIAGDDVALAHGNELYPFTYSVPQRGGSSYIWVVGGIAGGKVMQDKVYPSIAYITFNKSNEPTSAVVTVIETTSGGKVSEPFSKEIELQGFCPYNMDDYVGTYSGTAPGDHAPLVEIEAVKGLNIARVHELAYFLEHSWGESWIDGDGSCIIEFSCGDIVTIPPQWIGDSSYPDAYGIYGDGTVDPETKTISLNYAICYGWKGTSGEIAAEISTVLTKDGKKLSSSVKTFPRH